ncbi:MAG: ABC transporter permease [Actinomycetota bacterium]
MGRYLLRRTLFMLLVLFVISVLTFLIFVKLPPGDPARRLAGRSGTPEVIELIQERLGLNDKLSTQYARFAKGLIPWPGLWLNEEVYFSYANNVPVKEEIAERLPVTAVLMAGGVVLWLLIGIPTGVISAVKRRSAADRGAMLFALMGVSLPSFWLGMVMIYVFFYQLGWAPPTGIEIGASLPESILQGKFLLAWITLAVTSAAFYARMMRGNMLEVLSEDYTRTARAKGLSERRVIYKHGLRAALTPVVTMLGLDIAFLLGGAVITEQVFALPGLGEYALQSLGDTNTPGVMAVTIIGALFIVIANLVVDVVYAALDPRVRYS